MADMSKPVSTLMTTQIDKISKTTPVSEVRRLFAKHKYHHLPVIEGEQLIGIISTTDLMNLNIPDYGHDLIDKVIDRKFKLVEFIKTDLATIDAETTIKDALLILLSSDFHSLPVTDTSNRLLGMLTTKDMLKLLISNET